MKKIFDEREEVCLLERAWVSHRFEGVVRQGYTIYASCVAHYDKKLNVLVVDLKAFMTAEYEPFELPAPKRVYETHGMESRAIRSAIEHADAFFKYMQEAIPADDSELTDEQVIARDKAMDGVAVEIA